VNSSGEPPVFTSIVRYASSSLYRRALAAISAIIRPLLLSPEMFGLWTVLKVLPNYASYLHFGARTSMRFRIPRCEADGDIQSIKQFKAAVFYGSLLPNLAACVVLLALAALLELSPEGRAGLVAISLLLILNWRFDYFISVLKSHQKFRVVGATNYFRATLYLILTAALIALFGFYGVLLCGILTVALTTSYLLRLEQLKIPSPAEFHSTIYLDLVRNGLPIVVFNLIVLFLRTSDRFVLLYFFDINEVGFYGLAVMVMGLALSVPAVAREVVEPRLMQNFGRGGMQENILLYMTRPLFNTACLMPFIVGPAILWFPEFVALLLPDYKEGINVAIILLLSSYFTAAVYALRGIIVAGNQQLGASFLLGTALLFNLALSIGLVKSGFGMEAVALATGLTFGLLMVSLLVFIHRRLPVPGVALTYHLKFALIPFLLMCFLLFAPILLHPSLPDKSLIELLLHTILFLMVQGALFLRMWHKGLVYWKPASL
jgi:O-antigen/teichoic acid export membrane protein